METRRGTPVTHPLTRRVMTLTTEQSGRNDASLRPLWETTIRGRSPDILIHTTDTCRRTP